MSSKPANAACSTPGPRRPSPRRRRSPRRARASGRRGSDLRSAPLHRAVEGVARCRDRVVDVEDPSAKPGVLRFKLADEVFEARRAGVAVRHAFTVRWSAALRYPPPLGLPGRAVGSRQAARRPAHDLPDVGEGSRERELFDGADQFLEPLGLVSLGARGSREQGVVVHGWGSGCWQAPNVSTGRGVRQPCSKGIAPGQRSACALGNGADAMDARGEVCAAPRSTP